MQADRLLPVIGNRYQLEVQLGRGGMGAVYRATDYLTGEQVALKRVMTPTDQLQFASRVSDDGAASESTNLRLALAQEFHTLASLRHPNVIRVLDYGFDDQRQPYLTMDLLRESQNLLEAGQGQSLEAKVDLLVQMLQALAYLHRRDVIHRDLKPDNVAVVIEDGLPHVRVLDFGLALTIEDAISAGHGTMAGTIAYMAPEVFQGDDASIASDLYAVGVIAYEMFVGVHPFDFETADTLNSKNLSPITLINRILKTEPDLVPLIRLQAPSEPTQGMIVFGDLESPISLAEIVGRLLSKDPGDRYHEAYAVINDLCAAVSVPVPKESDAIRESFLQAARFVGRESELSQLRQALVSAKAGKGSLWLIGGESGVGKSRLIEELRKWALIEGLLTLNGQAATGGLPFQVWHEPLRRLILSTDLDTEELSALGAILPEIEEREARGLPPLPLKGADAQQRLVRVIIDLFSRQTRPIVLLLEDLHWAGEGLEVLRRLASFIDELPLLIVGSFRDDEMLHLTDELPQAHLLPLRRLAPSDIARLTEAMLGEVGLRPDVIDFLQAETEGNAFFLVETVRALAEEAGSLSRVGQETLPEHLLTGGMQQVIWRRLNRVPDWAQAWLRLAAVIGRELDPTLLSSILERETGALPDLDEWVTVCANRAVLDAYEGGWRFAHDKLREALLDALEPDERAIYHRQVAEALEAVYADDLERYASSLARHWREAGDFRKEGAYTITAARQAYATSSYEEARRLYDRALEIRAYEDDEYPLARQAELHYQLGITLYSMSEYDPAREQHRISLELARSIDDRKAIADAITGLGECDARQGLIDEGEAEFKEALAIRQELNLGVDIGYAYMNLGLIQTERARWEAARDWFKLTLDVMEQHGSPRDLARAYNNYANVIDLLGDHDTARELHLRALEIRERERDRHGVCFSLGNLGSLELDLGNYVEARPYLEKALYIARQIASRSAIGSCLGMLSDLGLKTGDYGSARTYTQEALEIRRQIEDRGGIVNSIRTLGDIARETGDEVGAHYLYGEALALSIEYRQTPQIWSTLYEIARLLMLQKKSRAALKLLVFIQANRDTPDRRDQDAIDELEQQMQPNAFASALALGTSLLLDHVSARIADGSFDF